MAIIAEILIEFIADADDGARLVSTGDSSDAVANDAPALRCPVVGLSRMTGLGVDPCSVRRLSDELPPQNQASRSHPGYVDMVAMPGWNCLAVPDSFSILTRSVESSDIAGQNYLRHLQAWARYRQSRSSGPKNAPAQSDLLCKISP